MLKKERAARCTRQAATEHSAARACYAGCPLFRRKAVPAISSRSPFTSVERAARSLGADWLRVQYRITLPLMVRSLFVEGLIAFQTSFDEIVVELFMSGIET